MTRLLLISNAELVIHFMSGKPEQIDAKGVLYQHKTRKLHRWLKLRNARFERRKAKQDPEEIPTYNKYKGWEL